MIVSCGKSSLLNQNLFALHVASTFRVYIIIRDVTRTFLLHLVSATLPGARVAVFGSCATGRARPFFDLDLLILAPASLSGQQRSALLAAGEASELPFRVDLVELAAVPASLHVPIEAEAVTL